MNLLRIPGGMEDERALFVEHLTTGVYGAGIAGIREGDTVAVVGAGPVGFLLLRPPGCAPARVLVLDMMTDRLDLVERVGATPINVAERAWRRPSTP